METQTTEQPHQKHRRTRSRNFKVNKSQLCSHVCAPPRGSVPLFSSFKPLFLLILSDYGAASPLRISLLHLPQSLPLCPPLLSHASHQNRNFKLASPVSLMRSSLFCPNSARKCHHRVDRLRLSLFYESVLRPLPLLQISFLLQCHMAIENYTVHK